VTAAHVNMVIAWLCIALFAAGGLALGFAYFASLLHGIRFSIARQAWSQYMLLALARIAAAGLLFALAARWSLPALLAAFLGFLIARQITVRSARRTA